MAGLKPARKPVADIMVETAMVFTNTGRNGNGLGVVSDARGLDEKEMQKIAKIVGFSETSFVFPAGRPGADYVVRFFTPKKEIPFAGHPSIGTLFVLLKKGTLSSKKRYVQRIGGRKVPLTLSSDGRIFMDQGKPKFGKKIGGSVLARLLGLGAEDVKGDGMVVSTGLPHILVPLASKDALGRAQIYDPTYEKVRRSFKADCVMPFFADGPTIHCRNFIPALGVAEDPATGSGCGPLACYIVRYGMGSAKKEDLFNLKILQGLGKTSVLFARVSKNNHEISDVEVGGYCRMGKKMAVNL